MDGGRLPGLACHESKADVPGREAVADEAEKGGRMMSLRFRAAGPDDAGKVALLHADSWRRHYRIAYADSFLDGDVVADRQSVWSSRLAARANSLTVVSEDDTGLVGFVHVVFDDDDQWGSLIDNLHVTQDRRRTGIGTVLLTCAAEAVAERATGKSMYLWVLEQNILIPTGRSN